MSSIEYGYKERLCYKAMEKSHRDHFDKLVTIFAPILEEKKEIAGLCVSEGFLTWHEFNIHCNNLYYYISDIFFQGLSLGGNNSFLSSKELFFLNVAVLLHDIALTKGNDFCDKNNHALKFGKYIESEKHYLINNGFVNSDVDILTTIIVHHSDLKKGTDEEKAELCNYKLADFMGKDKIKAKTISRILRLADEFDVTHDRLGNETIGKALPKDSLSYKCWEQLNYFSEIKLDPTDKDKIIFVLNDAYFRKCEFNEESLFSINAVINKINFEYNNIYNELGKSPDIFYYIGKKEILLLSELQEKIDNVRKNREKISVIDTGFSNLLKEKVYEDKLLKESHFILNPKFCSYDWIDVKPLVENIEFSTKISAKFVEHFKTEKLNFENIIFVGIGSNGGCLASNMAFNLGKPFSYFVTEIEEEFTISKEQGVVLASYDGIVLITDVIATWETISKIIENVEKSCKVIRIYSIFYRKANNCNSPNLKYNKITFSLNDTFAFDIINSGSCLKKGGKTCIGQNHVPSLI